MKKVYYILPSNLDHPGITTKVYGQINALSTIGKTTLLYYDYSKQSKINGLFHYIHFHIKACLNSLLFNYIYIRYNPKFPILNLWLWFLSFFKPIFMEYNINYTSELTFLNRYLEKWVHLITISYFKLSPIRHVSVTQEIQDKLFGIQTQSKRYLIIQNGYYPPDFSNQSHNDDIISSVKNLKKNYTKLAIFVGNHYPWHGLKEICEHIKHIPDVGLIIVGPSERLSFPVPENAHLFPFCTPKTLSALYDLCNVGIGTFRWDLINTSQGCPLKTREYLCHGLPIIINYHDSAEKSPQLSPYIYNYSKNKKAFEDCFKHEIDKKELVDKARKYLAWNQTMKPVFELIR